MSTLQRSSPKEQPISTPHPLFTDLISSVLIAISPTPNASSFPAACTATTLPDASRGGREAEGDVRPGLVTGQSVRSGTSRGDEGRETHHMMLAPARTNLIAPRSTCTCGSIVGSVKSQLVSTRPSASSDDRRCEEESGPTAMEELERGKVGTVKVLEEQRLAVQRENREMIPAEQ